MHSSSPDSKCQLRASIQVGLSTQVAHPPLLQLHEHIHGLPCIMQIICTRGRLPAGAQHRDSF